MKLEYDNENNVYDYPSKYDPKKTISISYITFLYMRHATNST